MWDVYKLFFYPEDFGIPDENSRKKLINKFTFGILSFIINTPKVYDYIEYNTIF